jgi:hypothetical protein
MEAKKQILVFGEVQGKLDDLFKKVQQVNKNQSFAFVLCLGSFFGGDSQCIGELPSKLTLTLRTLQTWRKSCPFDHILLPSH